MSKIPALPTICALRPLCFFLNSLCSWQSGNISGFSIGLLDYRNHLERRKIKNFLILRKEVKEMHFFWQICGFSKANLLFSLLLAVLSFYSIGLEKYRQLFLSDDKQICLDAASSKLPFPVIVLLIYDN